MTNWHQHYQVAAAQHKKNPHVLCKMYATAMEQLDKAKAPLGYRDNFPVDDRELV